MLDINGPLEFDNGEPAVVVRVDKSYPDNPIVQLKPVNIAAMPCAGRKGGFSFVTTGWWYNIKDGVFNGCSLDDTTMFRVQNAHRPEDLLPDRDWS